MAYTRDVTGALRKNTATLSESILKLLEYYAGDVVEATVDLPTSLEDLEDYVAEARVQGVPSEIVSPTGAWTEVCTDATATDASGDAVQTIAEIVAGHSDAVPLMVSRRCSHVAIRLQYDDGATPDVDPVICVLAIDPDDNVSKLRNLNGATNGTLTTAETDDVGDGTYFYTTPDDGAVFDCRGAAYILVGVETAFTVSGEGSDASTLQALAF